MATLNMSDITPPAAIPTGTAVTFFVATGSAAEGRPGEAGASSDGARQMMGKWMRIVRSRGRLRSARGYTLVEIVIAAAILAVALLAIANMFPTGYTNVTEAGRRTMGLTAARQILEDMQSIPFANLAALNGFASTDQATVPAGQPERDVARRWRYTLAGEGTGAFATTPAEEAAWTTLTTAVPFDGSVQVSVAPVCPTPLCPPNPVSGTLQLVTVTISFQAKAGSFQLATLVTSM